jgi:streptogramin lyase
MKKNYLSTLLMLALMFGGCQSKLKTPTLLGGQTLPHHYASPDGYALGPDGWIYVSINQKAVEFKNVALIARISPDDKIEDFCHFLILPEDLPYSPLGLTFAPDGNLYVTDNRSFYTNLPEQSTVVRIVIENGKARNIVPVVRGFNTSNGITCRNNCLYVAETNLRTEGKYTSGVYRIPLDELNGEPLRVCGLDDPHLILTFETKSEEQQVGANGVGFDSKGNLYVTNFGDAEIMKYTLDENGKVLTGALFCKPEGALSLDGMQIDSDDNIWVTDFAGNAVFKVETATGKSTLIAKNDSPTTGANGELDSPSECIRRGNKVYVSNIDIASVDSIQTISVIELYK